MRNLLYLAITLVFALPLMAQTETTSERTSTTAYNEAVEKMRGKDYTTAYTLFEEAISLASATEADSTSKKILRLANKNGAKAAYGYSIALKKEKQYEEMLTVATRGTEMDDDYYANYISLGQALDKTGKTGESVNNYFLAATYSEQAERPADKIASLYRSGFLKMYKAKNFDRIIEEIGNYPNALSVADINYYAAKAFEAKGDSEKAIEHAVKASEIGENKKAIGKYYFYLGELYKNASKVGQAIEAYKQVPEGNRYYGQAQYNIEKLN